MIEKEILEILEKLSQSGFEVAVVGGGVRDLLAGRKTGDWILK